MQGSGCPAMLLNKLSAKSRNGVSKELLLVSSMAATEFARLIEHMHTFTNQHFHSLLRKPIRRAYSVKSSSNQVHQTLLPHV